MMKTDVFQEFFGLKDYDEVSEENDISVEDLFEAEIAEVLAEMAVHHPDTPEYQKAADSLKVLSEAYQLYKRGQAETERVEADKANSEKQKWLKLCDSSLRVVGILASAGLTLFMFGLEQGRPVPTRFVNKVQDFMTLRT